MAATRGQAIVALCLFVFTRPCDRVTLHHAVGAVRRVAALAAAAAAGGVGEVDAAVLADLAVTPVDRLGDRLDHCIILRGRFHHRDHIVRMALLTDHALLAQAGVLGKIVVVREWSRGTVGVGAIQTVRITIWIGI